MGSVISLGTPMEPDLRAALLVLALLAAAWVGAWLARRWRRFRMERRFARGREGERLAREFLEAAGFRVTGTQASREVLVVVDEVPRTVEVIADFLAVRRGRDCLIEVKTGGQAPDPLYSPTRRQLLEYALAFPGRELHLLDMDARRLHRVRFPSLTPARGPWRAWTAGLAAGAAAGLAAGLFLRLT